MDKKILVIEDDLSVTRLLEYTLKQEGYQVITASNGVEGLKAAQEKEPDLIVLNVMLPGIDGFEVCHRLRNEPQTAQLPILMLSGKAHQIDVTTGFKVGADEYLTKPAKPSEIASRVESLLARKTAANSKTVAFLSSKRGVGTTTTVVNVAIALSQRGKQVIVVDICPYNGSISERLGVKPQDTFTHLLDKPIDTINRRDLESALAVHQTGIRVLSIHQPSEEQEIISAANIDLLFDRLREVTDYFLADLPFQPTFATRELLMKCDLAIVVSDYTADALTGVRSAVTLLRLLSLSEERMSAVVIDREGTFPDWELSKIKPFVEPNIGVSLLGIIPYDTKASLEPTAGSTPLILSNPNCPMAYTIKEIAQHIIAETTTNKDSSSTWVKRAWTEASR